MAYAKQRSLNSNFLVVLGQTEHVATERNPHDCTVLCSPSCPRLSCQGGLQAVLSQACALNVQAEAEANGGRDLDPN